MKRISIITTQAFSLSNFRGHLIKEIVSRGHTVFAFAPDYNKTTKSAVIALGAIPIEFEMSRTGMNPILDIYSLIKLIKVLKLLNLDINLSYFIKPVIYGTIAAHFAGIPNKYAMIEGAGYIFTNQFKKSSIRSFLRYFLIFVVTLLYKISLSLVAKVFILNSEDKKLFISTGMVKKEKIELIKGIGVDLTHFYFAKPISNPISFILVARLLREKGIYEYIEAARSVKSLYPNTRFILLGDVDLNPGSISVTEVNGWVNEGLVEWPGQVPDVREWLIKASVFVLPSYREGLPRSTQEAMAMGRAIITTDVPGCRETIQNTRNGFMIPVRDITALEQSMILFIQQPDLISSMGQISRDMAERNFNVHTINKKILKHMQL